MQEGWVCVYRSLLDHQIWTAEPFTRGQAWVDLILVANHKPGFFMLRGIKVEVQRGQVGWSTERLASRWKWSRTKVKNFLNLLEKEQQIIQQKNNVSLLITIVNYDEYQKKEQQTGVQKNSRRTAKEQQKDTNNNENNENKKLIYAEEFWEAYPKRNGRKVGKEESITYFIAEIKDEEVSQVIQAARNYAVSKTAIDGYAKDAIRFLRKGFWKDWVNPEESEKAGQMDPKKSSVKPCAKCGSTSYSAIFEGVCFKCTKEANEGKANTKQP